MRSAVNPFAGDRDREQIWEMLVRRDIEAFVSQDWSLVADDFDEVRFLGIHAHNDRNPDKWDAGFPTLASYRDEWLRQAAESAAVEYAESLAEGIFRATDLSVIDITGDVALARKNSMGRSQGRTAPSTASTGRPSISAAATKPAGRSQALSDIWRIAEISAQAECLSRRGLPDLRRFYV